MTNEEAAALPGHGAQKENEGSAAHSVGQGSERKRRRLREAGKSCEFDTGMMEERSNPVLEGLTKNYEIFGGRVQNCLILENP